MRDPNRMRFKEMNQVEKRLFGKGVGVGLIYGLMIYGLGKAVMYGIDRIEFRIKPTDDLRTEQKK